MYACPILPSGSITGDFEESRDRARFHTAPQFMALPMARSEYYPEDLPRVLEVREVLRLRHAVVLRPNREVFWVKFNKEARMPKLWGKVWLTDRDDRERVGHIHRVLRRKELRMTAVVVVDF
jgi:hypothetical protein